MTDGSGILKGFRDALQRGPLTGNQVTGVRFVLEDGATHVVDSSELAFRLAAQGAFREAVKTAQAVVLEPIMKVEVTVPVEFQGSVIGGLTQRKGTILDQDVGVEDVVLEAEVALNDMFGCAPVSFLYSTDVLTDSHANHRRLVAPVDDPRQGRVLDGVPAPLARFAEHPEGDGRSSSQVPRLIRALLDVDRPVSSLGQDFRRCGVRRRFCNSREPNTAPDFWSSRESEDV